MTLADTQALFHAAVTRVEGDRSLEVERCFTGSRDLPAAERLEIYADMYLWRLVDALREDYPKLAALLGDERFYALAEAYVREHPSHHHDLGRLGVHLPAFLRAHPDPGRPDLADLAALEWARSEVFFEAETEPARQDALAALSPEEFLEARLRLAPALRVLAVEHDAVGLWRALEHGEPAPPPAPGIHAMAVWRSRFEVFHTALELDEATALEAVASGDPLSRVCAAFAGREDATRAAFAAMTSWFDEGWIAAVERAR
jgi:Putative DNA-binding domain